MTACALITNSNRFFVRPNGAVIELVDGLKNKVVAEAYALAHVTTTDDDGCPAPAAPRKMLKVCQKLNERDFARRRQYGESRAAFAARTGRAAV